MVGILAYALTASVAGVDFSVTNLLVILRAFDIRVKRLVAVVRCKKLFLGLS